MSPHQNNISIEDEGCSEGALYKKVTTYGKTFELRFGYYDDIDRDRPPDIIYPNFINDPLYTDNGEPFVTMMQDVCENYLSNAERTLDSTCSECKYFQRGEEWFGICTHEGRRERKNE